MYQRPREGSSLGRRELIRRASCEYNVDIGGAAAHQRVRGRTLSLGGDEMTDNLVAVYGSQGPLAAEVAKSKLESEGITAILRYEAVGRALGLTVDGVGWVEVLVKPEDAALARELLEEGPCIETSEPDQGPA